MIENILYHGLCLVMLLLLFIDYLGKEKKLTGSLETVYYMTALIVVSDCLWDTLSAQFTLPSFVAYAINIVYFIAEVLAVYAWMRFALRMLNSPLYFNKKYLGLLTIPALLITILTLLSPFTGYVFRIENGEYIRGSLFFIDTIAKLGYLAVTSGYAYYCYKREPRKYLRNQYGLLALYAVPIVVGGVIQALTYADLNCVAPVVGLAIIYKNGLTNEARENESLIDAIAKAYSGAFIVNTDTHKVRTILATDCYKTIEELAKTNSYEECVRNRVQSSVVPEDRLIVEQGFALTNILQHLSTNNAYTLTYRIQGPHGQAIYNKVTFIKAFSEEDRNEIFIGIEKVEARQILLQRKVALEREKEELEQVKESLTNVVANIIEARDIDSGEHVMRVKNYTQYLANQIMADYPKYGLTPRIIRYITSGSALHDIGKIMIPDSILLKPGALTAEEFEIMKTHCEKGCLILNRLPDDLDKEYVKYAKEICRWHHERFDGSGYPDHLKGNQIPISAQIVSIADCFDALTSKRVYKDAISKQAAFEMIINGECGVFNKDVIESFKKVYDSDIK